MGHWMGHWHVLLAIGGVVILLIVSFFFRQYAVKKRQEAALRDRRVRAGREALALTLGDIVPHRSGDDGSAGEQHARRSTAAGKKSGKPAAMPGRRKR